MPTLIETPIRGLASCHNSRCLGYKQEPVDAIRVVTEFSYVDLGGDIPGVERSSEMFRFADVADAQCPVCGEPRLVSDQTRPIYQNISGQAQDHLANLNSGSERVRELELQAARSDAQMAQMQAAMERQSALIERMLAEKESPRTRARAIKDEPQA
jgi:hypothetical protein